MAKTETTHFIEMRNCRTGKQREVMQEILDAGHCPFCKENLGKYHKKEILKETNHWIVTYNQWSYPNTKLHLLLITKEHTENPSDLPQGAGEEFFEILKWAEEEFHISGGATWMRFGEAIVTGATVRHLHAQIAVPSSLNNDPFLIYIGGSKRRST